MKIWCDFETTGINPMWDEIITGYFIKENGDDFNLRCQTSKWSEEAASIHGISYDSMKSFPKKNTSIKELVKWLPSEFNLVCYANPKTMLGHIYFDSAILKMELMDYFNVNKENQLPFRIKTTSIYDLVKWAYSEGIINVNKGEKGRISYSQYNVYKSIFNSSYKSHVAKDDVLAMIEIEQEIVRRHTNNINAQQNKEQQILI